MLEHMYAAPRQACGGYTRCATCALSADCVWCPASGGCVPGRPDLSSRQGCRFEPDGSGGRRCDCEAGGCPLECGGYGCGECLQDGLCGWCAGTAACQLDLSALPSRAAAMLAAAGRGAACPSGWLSNSSTVRESE